MYVLCICCHAACMRSARTSLAADPPRLLSGWWTATLHAVHHPLNRRGGSAARLCAHVPVITFLPGAPMRRGGLSVWVRLYVCVSAKTRLFAVLLLENRHEIALYRSASQFIFFERCLQSRTTLLSSAMAQWRIYRGARPPKFLKIINHTMECKQALY